MGSIVLTQVMVDVCASQDKAPLVSMFTFIPTSHSVDARSVEGDSRPLGVVCQEVSNQRWSMEQLVDSGPRILGQNRPQLHALA